jgi:pimeloyl-ACP methyl ester carboxylesterase
MYCVRFIAFLLIFVMSGISAQAQEQAQSVVLLHGIAKNKSDMRSIEKFLSKEGYEIFNIAYPSRKKDLNGIAVYLHDNYLNDEFWANASEVHIVTHSMGGLVARRYLDVFKDNIPEGKIGRVVMLAPPNGGSEVADTIHNMPAYKWFYGPAGEELTTEAQSNNASDVYYDLGIIAGTKEWTYPVAAFVIPGESDGRVSVEKTKIEGMKDHVSVHATHTFIMNKDEVHQQILHFLKNGVFIRKEEK